MEKACSRLLSQQGPPSLPLASRGSSTGLHLRNIGEEEWHSHWLLSLSPLWSGRKRAFSPSELYVLDSQKRYSYTHVH